MGNLSFFKKILFLSTAVARTVQRKKEKQQNKTKAKLEKLDKRNPQFTSKMASKEEHDNDEIREQDRFLPTANISRIMKVSLPSTAKIAKDGKETVQECVSEFISFITSEASDKCQQEKRKTINGDDIIWAMSTLGFDSYVEPLKLYLQKYRESVKVEKNDKKDNVGSFGASS